MIRLILIFFLFASSAFAQTVPTVPYYNLTGQQYASNPSIQKGSALAACEVYAASFAASYTVESKRVTGSTCYVDIFNPNSGGRATFDTPVYTVYACPSGTTRQDSYGDPTASTLCVVSCPPGQVYSTVTNRCGSDCSGLAGQTITIPVNCSSAAFPSSVCLPNNCAGSSVSATTGFDKVKSCYFGQALVKLTGSECTGQPNSSNFTNPQSQPTEPMPSAESECVNSGKSFGTVNGAVVCVPAGTSGAASVSSSSNTTTTKTETTAGNQTSTDSKNTETTSSAQDGIATLKGYSYSVIEMV